MKAVKPQNTLGRITTPDGMEFILHERDGAYAIRVDGRELMTSRAHGSEEALARLILSRFDERHRPAVLVGGLGMGYTLRAVLDARDRFSTVVVSELFPAVVQWNRNELAHLARRPLDDSRVTLVQGDVAELIAASPNTFDAILLDVDNGPAAFTVARTRICIVLAALRRSIVRSAPAAFSASGRPTPTARSSVRFGRPVSRFRPRRSPPEEPQRAPNTPSSLPRIG